MALEKKQLDELRKYYGKGFPDYTLDSIDKPEKKKEAGLRWREWIRDRVERQRSIMRDKRLHWSRHRHFRQGHQWISTRDGRSWREPSADKNTVRAVLNVIGPSLDFRLGLLDEQRPGFRANPLPGAGVNGREAAEAQQSVAEYYYYTQRMWRLERAAASNAQTDGASFLHVFVDKNSGDEVYRSEVISREDERFEGLKAQGYKESETGQITAYQDTQGQLLHAKEKEKAKFNKGEIRTRVVLAHSVVADPEAKSFNHEDRAKWVFIRRPRVVDEARLEVGDPKLDAEFSNIHGDPLHEEDSTVGRGFRWQRGLPPFPTTRHRVKGGSVWDYTIYIAPSKGLPNGLWRRIVGDHLVGMGDELPERVIPLARISDGSSDPDLFPRPVMSDWIGDQVAINSLMSKALAYARLHGGSRVLAQKDTLLEETYSNVVGSVIEYTGAKPDVIEGLRSSSDIWNLLQFLISKLQDKTGWTELARGQVTGSGSFDDVSGRALLGARELFERQFGPMIRATAEGMTEWAELIVAYSRWLFADTGRMIPRVGRPDLAKMITRETLGEVVTVYVDPETLMPLPRALRNQMLFDLLEKGLITVPEYKKRAPYADIKDSQSGDVDQWNRAQWINTVLEERWEELVPEQAMSIYSPESGVPVLWQDDPETHMKALEELILNERNPWPLRKIATDRWGVYFDLIGSKFPPEGMPPAPAPAEVIGVPNAIPQASPPTPEVTGGPPGTPSELTGTPVLAAPLTSPTALPTGSQQQAQPLGSVGMEQGLEQ
jgi:hypothetical protein